MHNFLLTINKNQFMGIEWSSISLCYRSEPYASQWFCIYSVETTCRLVHLERMKIILTYTFKCHSQSVFIISQQIYCNCDMMLASTHVPCGAAVTWLKYCLYGVKLFPINQSSCGTFITSVHYVFRILKLYVTCNKKHNLNFDRKL